MLPASILENLTTAYPLTEDQIRFYDTYRYIKLQQVLSDETISFYNKAIGERVSSMNKVASSVSERDTYGKAFLQLFNLWREDPLIRDLVFSQRLGKIATELMQVGGVRIYHDQALFKEPGGGITPWHADQFYWPLETDKTVTAWIPLQKTGLAMGPLAFCAGSHHVVEGRELAIGDESEKKIAERLRVTDYPQIETPFDLGEISFHSGWIFHRAGANTTPDMRKVMTIIYMDKDMRLKRPENQNQVNDWETWCPGASVGEIIQTPLNPQVYPTTP